METKNFCRKIYLMTHTALRKTINIGHILFGIFILGSLMLYSCEKDIENNLENLKSADAQTKAAVNIKSIDMELVAEGLVSPLGLVEANDETGNLFVIDECERSAYQRSLQMHGSRSICCR